MAADKLPAPQLKVPQGFKIDVFVSGVPNARSLRLGDKGTVFVSNRLLDKVYAVVDKGGKRELKVAGSGLDRPNGLAFRKARSTSPKGRRSRSSKTSRTTSTIRPSRSSSTTVPEPPVARLEVHGARGRQQALHQCRRAL
jgi:hypothetical protein